MAIIPNLQFLEPIIQDNTLQRMFYDQLYPKLLYRMEAEPVLWLANEGDTIIKTRNSNLPVQTDPLVAGADPAPVAVETEQWSVTACQYGSTLDTQLPSSRAAMSSKFANDARNIATQAGRTLNRLARNKLFTPYAGGTTHTDTAATSVTVPVGSINGFTTVISGGAVQTVSSTFPKAATIDTATVSVIAAVPNDAAFPLGAGVLTLAASDTFSAGDVVVAGDAPKQFYSGGGASTDALATSSILTLEDIRNAVASLQENDVPPLEDGYYHVHLSPTAQSQIFGDAEFQNLNESNYGDVPYQQFVIGKLLGCLFYRNSESPGVANTGGPSNTQIQTNRPADASASRLGKEISADIRNKAGVAIIRTIIIGGGSIIEQYVPEADYITEAGVTGMVGGFSVSINGMTLDLERIRYTLRAPLDRLQQIVAQSWSFTGDWGVPSDLLGGLNVARFKRSVVINSGTIG